MTRLLVVGAGLIGRRHAARIIAHPDLELAGIVDPDQSAAPEIDAPRFATMDSVDIAVDGAVIATPTPLHARQAQDCIARGWPLLIEKPVTATVDEADALAGAARAAKLPVLVGHHRRHHPRVKALTEMLDTGSIGAVQTVSLIWAMRKPDAYFAGNWRSAGGSPVLINIVHDLDLLLHWFGPVTQTVALPGAPTRGSGRIESGAIAVRFASGPVATIAFADTTPSPWGFEAGTGENPNIGTTGQDMMWITGTQGAIAFPSLTLWRGSDWSRPAMSEPGPRPTDIAPLDAQLDHFRDILRGRASPVVTIEQARDALALALDIETRLRAGLG